MALRSYFHEIKREVRKSNILANSAFYYAGQKSGCQRWKEFFRGQLLLLQTSALVEELKRIWKNRHLR